MTSPSSPLQVWSSTQESKAEALAVLFHEAYERLAPSFGYSTRPETRTLDLQSANGRLMVAVCQELIAADDTRKLYDELLYAVGKKWPDETRHQTALKYIRRAEEPQMQDAAKAGSTQERQQ